MNLSPLKSTSCWTTAFAPFAAGLQLYYVCNNVYGLIQRDYNDRDQLDRGFSRLEPEARALIVLHHYLDLPLPEVAFALGIPLGTAKAG